ncbi:hypothetical protein CYY_010513 [Polysphondylium violaceum]|uniref:Pterin-binding domain-containing protein n=1 Tax=Polysphondylium violaceum TaxID=133409 RepID=A0A8J4UZQ3_9MYCE|nr:hypothetical protein CYY_010513 [Polysphondylium violaceum]
MAGDFNCTVEEENPLSHLLNSLSLDNDLVDTGAGENRPTRRSVNGTAQRIDRIYAHSSLLPSDNSKVEVDLSEPEI